MTRFEIIVNQSIEEDIIALFEANEMGDYFTCISHVYGRGKHGRREGTAIWPEENVIFIVYIDDEKKEQIAAGLEKIKKEFPDEGLRCYVNNNFERIL